MGIKLYGNSIWNSVTSNSDKSIIVVEENKLNNIINALESVGMNYCAYTNDGNAKIAINDSDVDRFRRLSLDYGDILKSKISSPTINNIIGNTTYKSINNKDYHKYDTDLALKIAQELEKQNINFSGRIYGKSTTITIDKNNADVVEEIADKVKFQRSIFERKGDIYIDNNINIGEFNNKGYINLQMSVADYEDVKDYLQERASYSAVVAENICTFYCEKKNAENLKELIEEAQSNISTKEVANFFVQFNYTSTNQLDAIKPVIQFYMERYEDDNFTDSLKNTFEHTSNYSPEQLSVLGEMFIDTFKDLHNLECIFADTSAIYEYKTNIKNENTLNAIVSERGYNQEQAECIKEMLNKDFSRTLIDLLDYTFTPNDMERFVQASKDYRSILEVVADVKKISVNELDMLLRNEAYVPAIPDPNSSVVQIEAVEVETIETDNKKAEIRQAERSEDTSKNRDLDIEEKTPDVEPTISLFDNINRDNVISTQGDEPTNTEKSISEQPVPEHKASVDNASSADTKQPEEAPDNKNFRIEDNNSITGAKTKYRNNVNAIRILQTLESENRNATPEEKKALSLYSGWGGLRYAFEGKDEKWKNEFNELKKLLTDDEYASASASTLDSFYTSNEIIDSIYKALDNLGFNGGDVLEPAMGVGNFFGRLPEKLQDTTNLYGVEKDSLSGRIATKLYPEANIKIDGFEKTNFQDGSFDIAIGNIPFGDFSVNDSRYNSQNLKIHDYFFTKALDKVRDGGVVAFVTSKGTLDKKDSTFRKSLSEKADLLGAIRLPNNAFKSAGTEVTSDIIFLQKRSTPPDKTPDWVNTGVLTDGINELSINKYFIKNREMVLGEIVEGNKMYGRNDDTMVIPYENENLSDLLDNAVNRIFGTIPEINGKPEPLKKIDQEVTVPQNLRSESFFMHEKDLYFYGSNSEKNLETVSAKELWGRRYTKNNIKRAEAYIKLRSVVRELLEAQQSNASDEKITELQGKLNTTYDNFNKMYGLIQNRTNRFLFNHDTSYPLLSSLEEKVDKDKLIKKSDIFTKRTIKPAEVIEHADNAKEALTISIFQKGNVDLEYMSKLTDIPENVLVEQLRGEIYPVPELSTEDNIIYQTASEYLSGDIYKKLEIAEASAMNNPMYQSNCTALEKAKPEPLKAGDIDINLGATWLDKKYYEQFMYEVFQTPNEHRIDRPSRFPWQNKGRKNIEIEYSEHAGKWNITNKNADKSVTTTKTYGIPSKNAYQIFENILNLNDPKAYKDKIDEFGNTVFDERGKPVRVLDMDTTKILQQKSKLIRREFKDWIFRDPQRRNEIVEKYNREFNCIKPREYDGSGMTFPEMNANIKLHDHQKNAIAHAIFGGNTLFAHSVGAGKTFEMIATSMESKRLGFCNKSMFVVPNHLTEQVGSDFLKLYPQANILVATKKDFEKANRQKFMSKIATGSYDAVIIGHSQITKLPISPQRQKEIYKEQIRDIINGISELKEENGSSFLVKAMERTKKSIEDKLNKLEAKNKDNTVYFEELGIDKLFVDEAHEFKNLMSVTKLQNVSGISSRASQRATELFMKCRYLDEKTGGKGVVFATGTPISNSVTELHTMMRYLQYDFLASHNNMQNFDNWVSTFGKQKTEYELAPTGNKFKERTRIAEYANMPELISMFKQVADIKTSDTLNLNVPECELHIVNVEPTELQQDLVEELSMRADDVNTGAVDPSVDNMLKITGDGRKVGLDPRLIDPNLEDNPNTKLNQCVSNVLRFYKETAEEKLTQIIFCDLGVPKSKNAKEESTEEDNEEKSIAEIDAIEESGVFCIYEDIKEKLIAQGVAPQEIAFIHDANNEQQKAELFAKVRSGEVRVLLGSTGKMGTGTNVQDRIIAMHDLDVPWRPSDLEQRRGRMVRQGNINKKVHLFRYVTKGTFDAYSYQVLEKKQKFISQIMTSKAPARKCSDVDQEALTYSEIKALCTGDERIKEKLTLENRVAELSLYRTEYFNTKYELEDKVNAYPDKREQLCTRISNIKADIEKSKQIPLDDENMPVFKATIGGTEYTERKEATQALFSAVNSAKNPNNKGKTLCIGDVYGFSIELKNDGFFYNDIQATIVGAERYTVSFTDSASSNLKKLEKAISQFENHLFKQTSELNKLDIDYESAKEILAKPFEFENELNEKSERLSFVTNELNTEAMNKLKSEEPQKRTHLFGKKTILSERRNDPPNKENKAKSKDDKSI